VLRIKASELVPPVVVMFNGAVVPVGAKVSAPPVEDRFTPAVPLVTIGPVAVMLIVDGAVVLFVTKPVPAVRLVPEFTVPVRTVVVPLTHVMVVPVWLQVTDCADAADGTKAATAADAVLSKANLVKRVVTNYSPLSRARKSMHVPEFEFSGPLPNERRGTEFRPYAF
jgi:hypothetical protein